MVQRPSQHIGIRRLEELKHEQQCADGSAELVVERNMKDGDRWIFVDDLIASGNTINRVTDEMLDAGLGRMVGYLMYNYPCFTSRPWRD